MKVGPKLWFFNQGNIDEFKRKRRGRDRSQRGQKAPPVAQPDADWLVVALVGLVAVLVLAGRLAPEDVAQVLGWWLAR